MVALIVIGLWILGALIVVFLQETKIGKRIKEASAWVIVGLMMIGMVIAFFKAIIHYSSMGISAIVQFFHWIFG